MPKSGTRLRRTSHTAARGFTITETMLVVTLLGLMLAIGLPRLGNIRQRTTLENAAQQLAGDLRRAQIEAIKRNRSVQLQRTGPASYAIDFLGERSLADGVEFRTSSASGVRLAPYGPPVGGGATFVVEYSGRRKMVAVSAGGLLTVQ